MTEGAAGPSVQSRPGALTVTDPRLFAAGQEEAAGLFARRLMRFPEVQSLEIDPVPAKAILRYRVPADDPQALVDRFASALTGQEALSPESLPAWTAGQSVTLYRHGDLITTLAIRTSGKSRIEARHPFLGHEPTEARQMEAALSRKPGILHAAVADATVRVRFDPARTSTLNVVRCIESELPGHPDPYSAQKNGEARFGLANTSLGVTTLAEFVVEALTPVGAGFVVFNGLGAVRTATVELRDGKIGLPALYTSILAATLVTGQFFGAAVMAWCFRMWEKRYREDVETETQAMLDEGLSVPREAVVVTREGLEETLPRREIVVGQRLRVRQGECVPVDAIVVGGVALVDEAILRGGTGPVNRAGGDEVLAGARLLAGELYLEAIRTGRDTRAAQTAQTLVAATVPSPVPGASALNPQAETFAGRIVPPTMVAAGVGLLVGGPTMALAVLRPDYATGVGLAAPLGSIRDARIAMRHSALIRSADAMNRLAKGSWVILEDHPELWRTDSELAEIRRPEVSERQLLPALAAAGAWLGDPRGPALVRACRTRGFVARRADLREIDSTGVAIEYGKHVLWLRGYRDPAGLNPLHVEVDGRKVAELHFSGMEQPAAAASVRRLQRAGIRVMLYSDRSPSALAAQARILGVDECRGNVDADSRRDLLRNLVVDRGEGVIHVHRGGMLRDPEDPHLSVALTSGCDGDAIAHDADIIFFGRSIASLPELAALARDSVSRAGRVRRLALAPNLFCVAGAFIFGFPALAAIVISNLGTSIIYNHARRALESIADTDMRLSADTWCSGEEMLTNHASTDVNSSAA